MRPLECGEPEMPIRVRPRSALAERFVADRPLALSLDDATTYIEERGGEARLSEMYDRILEIRVGRPGMTMIHSVVNDVGATSQRLLEALRH